MSPISEARRKANAEHDKENFQHITFKTRKGAKERIVEATKATGNTTDGFIRSSLDKAVQEATGKPMENASPQGGRTRPKTSGRPL